MTDDPRDATIRRLRSELARAREDIAALEQRLSYAETPILGFEGEASDSHQSGSAATVTKMLSADGFGAGATPWRAMQVAAWGR